jgi:predicted ATPase/class 3 adenylate cyclase
MLRSMTAAADPALISFLLTDIEGSTRLWEEQAASMAVALEQHDRLLRGAIEAAGGTVLKMTGDGLLAMFADSRAAVGAAVAAQRALAEQAWPISEPLRVRMAVHAGAVQARDGDYHGPTLNRVARLLAIGHGGQVLVSEAVAHGVDATRLIDHGAHRLRDIERPEHVFEVRATERAGTFPLLRSETRARSNVPQQLTSFVGRTDELAALEASTGRYRLVTLVGVGGTGKTRLMLESAARLQDREPDGAWLVELAPLGDPGAVVLEIARTFGLVTEPTRPVVDLLADFLRSKELDLLLDNCEHVIGAVADLCHRLLAECPRLRVVATSREPLGVPGEHVFPVPSLPLPPPVTPVQQVTGLDPELLETIAASDSVKLFVDRASAIVPTFALGLDNAAAIVEICRRLDGIPLAIELAASRISALSVHEIEQRLSDRFRLLTGGRRTAMPRQQTLKALIDWSWDLLDAADRRLLRRLSVFAGGWTLEAAEAVTPTGDPGEPAPDLLDGLTRLADRSLLTIQRTQTTRYGMLETIRQYARDQLVESGESERVRDAHLAWVVDLATRAEPHVRGPESMRWFVRLDAESDNIRAAMEWAFEFDPESAIRICALLLQYWSSRNPSGEVLGWLERAAEAGRRVRDRGSLSRERAAWVARGLSVAAFGWSLWATGDAAEQWAAEGLALAREADDQTAILEGVTALGIARAFRGHTSPADLEAWRSEFMPLATAQGSWWRIAFIEASTAFVGQSEGSDTIEQRLEQARVAALRSRDPNTQAYVAAIHGSFAARSGDLAGARRWYGEALAAYEELGSRRFQLITRSDLAHALRRAGQPDEAETEYRRTIVGWLHEGARGALANQLEAFAFIAVDRGEIDRAARILGAAEALRTAADAVMFPHEQREYDAAVGRLWASGDARQIDAAWSAGRELSAQAAVDLALER